MVSQARSTEWIRDILERNLTRITLSALILVSVSPLAFPGWADLGFFVVFALELAGRVVVLRADAAQQGWRLRELLFLALDALATLSFLPLDAIWPDAHALRLLRLSRLLLILGYWGPYVRDLGTVLRKRERRFQLLFAAFAVLVLSFFSAILLYHLAGPSADFNGDGVVGNDGFAEMLWWSFRMVQDPGNLVSAPSATLAFLCSTLLTLSGLFVFSFIIGLATSVVDELVTLGRERRLGLKRHTVLCNVSEYAEPLLRELVTYYEKSGRAARLATLGPAPTRYSFMYRDPLSKVRYRQGQPLLRHDLQKVDVDRATRVILLGQRGQPESDAGVISQILSVRAFNPEADLYAEIFRPDNVHAALEAGGARIIPLLTDRLVGQLLAKLVAFPGMEQLFDELLTSRGNEIYTALYDQAALAGQEPPAAPLAPYADLVRRARRRHGVILLGPVIRSGQTRRGYRHRLVPAPDHSEAAADLVGLVGVAERFSVLQKLAVDLARPSSRAGSRPEDALPPEPPSAAPESIPGFVLCPETSQMKRLLVCGFHPGVVPFCEHILLLASTPELLLMVPDLAWRDRARELLLAHEPAASDREPSVRFSPGADPGHLRYEVTRNAQVERSGSVQLLVGDWTVPAALRDLPGVEGGLHSVDVVVFTYLAAPGDARLAAPGDPDANTSLGLLNLLQMTERQPEPGDAPPPRVVCELRSQEKAALLAERYGHRSRPTGPGCHKVSILSAEQMRHDLIAQAVFVPGLDLIYRQLLGEAGLEILRLVPEHPACRVHASPDADTPSDGEVTFDDLLDTLLDRDGLLLIAAEIHQDGARQIVVNPPFGSEGATLRWSELQAIFAIGELDQQPTAATRCARCSLSPDPARPH